YRIMTCFDIRVFHVNVKSARKMLDRWFLNKWEKQENREMFPSLDEFIKRHVTSSWGLGSIEEAERFIVNEFCKELVPYDPSLYGDYPTLLKERLHDPKYRVIYNAHGEPVGRNDTVG
ncbi:MAG: hypothetical protein FJY85_15880, partial [Deltaproteobacteria bacterium]|nr:hypothetical protein [Deltaproteobacteria bacterium]